MTGSAYVIGLDLGTSSVKALAFDPAGHVLAAHRSSVETHRPSIASAEQDPEEWWAAVGSAVRGLAASAALAGASPLAIGLSGQMHGVVIRDARSQVIRPCLIWADERGADQLADLAGSIRPARVLAVTGNPLNAGFSAPKLAWIRDHEPEAWEAARMLLFPKDDVRLRLTGEFATDASDASGSLLFDLEGGSWSTELVRAWGFEHLDLPPLRSSSASAGRLLQGAADHLGVAPGIPVAVGAGDTVAAASGLGIISGGDAAGMLGIGTAAQLLVAHDRAVVDPRGRLNAVAHAWPGTWCSMAAILDGGGALAWIRSICAPAVTIEHLLTEADRVQPGSEGLTFLPQLSGERTPGMDPTARGSFVGLTIGHARAHLVRAVLEGVAYSLREGLEILADLGIAPAALRIAGGPAASAVWLQILADTLDLPIEVSRIEHGSARGAGLLAATMLDDTAPGRWGATIRDGIATIGPRPAGRHAAADGYAAYRDLRVALASASRGWAPRDSPG